DLGRAYVELGAFAEAHEQLETCIKRRGESLSLFLDDMPTSRVYPPVHYYLGRAQEGLGSPAAAGSYRTVVEMRSAASQEPRGEQGPPRRGRSQTHAVSESLASSAK